MLKEGTCMKTFEMKQALSQESIKKHYGAIVVSYISYTPGNEIIQDAREIGLGGFHLVCKNSHLFQVLAEMLNAGATVLGTGLVDLTMIGPDCETIETLLIGVEA
jgi:hypothetical protein